MKIVFMLSDGRTIEVPSERVHLTCITEFNAPVIDPNMEPFDIDGHWEGDAFVPDKLNENVFGDSVKWCEDLWKLEDKR